MMRSGRGLFIVLTTLLIVPQLHAQQLSISGSTTAYLLVSKAAMVFMEDDNSLDISVASTGSSSGIEQLINGQVDIAVSSRYLFDEEIRLAASRGIHLVPFQIAYDYVIPVVHPKSRIKDISQKQLRNIFSGAITNWQAVGGSDLEIEVITRDKTSGTYSLWETKILQGQQLFDGAEIVDSNFDMVEQVSRNPKAIGYISHGYLNLYVKPLSIDGVYGTRKGAINGNYPLNRTIFFFTRGWPQGKTLEFINFVLNPDKGQKLVKESGFVSAF